MNNLPSPPALAAPFAVSGNRSTLPVSSGASYGAASLLQGFPPETALPLSGGGVPPKREDMNALGYVASFPQYFLEAGGYFTYSDDVASKINGYPLGAVLTYYNSSGGEVRKLRSLVPNNMHNFVTSPGAIGDYWQDVTPVVGVGRTMFEFFWNFSTEIPAGALQLNGQLLTGCDNPQSPYYDFYIEGKRLAAQQKIAVTTMATYVSELQVRGECNFFVFDQNNSGVATPGCMRIPTVKNFIQAGTPGMAHLPGLPNITGTIPGENPSNRDGYWTQVTGAFYKTDTTNRRGTGSGDHDNTNIGFDASRVNSVFGRTNTVQPQSIELVPCIQYAKGTGNAGGGGGSGGSGGSGGITPGQASSIAAEVIESGNFNCSGAYNFIGGLTASGSPVLTVDGLGSRYVPLSGNWTAQTTPAGNNRVLLTMSGGSLTASANPNFIHFNSDGLRLDIGGENWQTSANLVAGDSAWLINTISPCASASLYLLGDHYAGLTCLHDSNIASVFASAFSAGMAFTGDGGDREVSLRIGDGGLSYDWYDIADEYATPQTLRFNSTGMSANSSALTMVSSSWANTDSLGLAVVSGGVKYICQSALTTLSIGSAAPGCNAAIYFKLASGAVVTPPANVPLFGEAPTSTGVTYCMAINGDMAVCAPAIAEATV